MKKLGFVLLLMTIALMLGGTALAQDYTYYFTTYFSNANTANAPDATVRIINDGYSAENMNADFYVFDDSEELTECCACLVTPDGLLSESVNKNLTANPLTGIKPTRGVIKVVGSATTIPPNDPTNIVVAVGLRGWATHIQKAVSGYAVTETLLADSDLNELSLLESLCKFDGLLSGKPCTCTPEDADF